MAKRSLKGDASFGSSSKRFKSSSTTSEPHETKSLLTPVPWKLPIPSPAAEDKPLASTLVPASFQEPTHSTTALGSLHAHGSSGSVIKATQMVEKRQMQDGYDLAVVPTFDHDLPTEVLEMILCQVSFQDLFFSCRRVCKRWNDIVMREKVWGS